MEGAKDYAQDCETLRRALEALDARDAQADMEAAIAAKKQECRQLRQEMAESRRETMMTTSGIQGSLEEARRMLKDHLDQTEMMPADHGLGHLFGALADARAKAAAAAEETRRVQKECDEMVREAVSAEDGLRQAQEDEDAAKLQVEHMMTQLITAQGELDDLQCLEQAYREQEAVAESAVIDLERLSNDLTAIEEEVVSRISELRQQRHIEVKKEELKQVEQNTLPRRKAVEIRIRRTDKQKDRSCLTWLTGTAWLLLGLPQWCAEMLVYGPETS